MILYLSYTCQFHSDRFLVVYTIKLYCIEPTEVPIKRIMPIIRVETVFEFIENNNNNDND